MIHIYIYLFILIPLYELLKIQVYGVLYVTLNNKYLLVCLFFVFYSDKLNIQDALNTNSKYLFVYMYQIFCHYLSQLVLTFS